MGRNHIYIASQYSNREMIKKMIVPVVEQLGMDVTSRWLTTPESSVSDQDKTINNQKWLDHCNKMAPIDLEDIDRAHSVLFVPDDYNSTGGMWVELGYALAKGKIIIWYGQQLANVFAVKSHFFCTPGNLVVTLARVSGRSVDLGKLANMSQLDAKKLV